ncbi:MAG: hypothetical protein ABR511_11285 [Acidimicrobiales bacterium]
MPVATIVAGLGAAALAGLTAFACTNLATLSLSTPDGRPADTVVVTGSGFSVTRAATAAPAEPGPTPTPVVLHWNAIDGPVLASTVPDGAGTFRLSFTVPDAPPGNYMVVATQSRQVPVPTGATMTVNELGTPARVAFEVTAVGAPLLRAGSSSPVSGADSMGGDLRLGVAVLLVALCLGATVVGVVAITCDPRRRPAARPATARRR